MGFHLASLRCRGSHIPGRQLICQIRLTWQIATLPHPSSRLFPRAPTFSCLVREAHDLDCRGVVLGDEVLGILKEASRLVPFAILVWPVLLREKVQNGLLSLTYGKFNDAVSKRFSIWEDFHSPFFFFDTVTPV